MRSSWPVSRKEEIAETALELQSGRNRVTWRWIYVEIFTLLFIFDVM